MRVLTLIVSAVLLAAGCGQRGPLYLLDQPPPGQKATKADTYQPVPYPPDPEREREKTK